MITVIAYDLDWVYTLYVLCCTNSDQCINFDLLCGMDLHGSMVAVGEILIICCFSSCKIWEL